MEKNDDSATDSNKSSSSKGCCHITVVDPLLSPDNDVVTIDNEDGVVNESLPTPLLKSIVISKVNLTVELTF